MPGSVSGVSKKERSSEAGKSKESTSLPKA